MAGRAVATASRHSRSANADARRRDGDPRPPGRGSRQIVVGIVVAALILLPAIVAIALTIGRKWVPVDDFAIIDLRVRDVWSLHPPLSGLISRNGWNHPGPAMFWLIGLFSGATGAPPWATRVGGTLLQLIALGWLVWVTWRHSLRMLLAAATVTSLSYLALGQWLFVQPWNLWVPIPFFILFVFLVCLAADGAFRQLIAISLVGSLIVQTHISYALFVVAGFIWVIGWTWADARGDGQAPDRWRSTVIVSAAIWFVSWIPPMLDVVTDWPGNLGRIASYFVHGEGTTVGLSRAVGLMSAEFHVVPPWLGGYSARDSFTTLSIAGSAWWLVAPVALLVVAAFAGHTRALRIERRMVGFAALLLGIGILAISRADAPRGYTFQWRVVIAAFVVVVGLWSLGSTVSPRIGPVLRALALVLVVACVAWGSISHTVRLDPDARVMSYHGDANPLEAHAQALDDVMAQLRRGDHVLPGGPVLLVARGGRDVLDGVVNELDRDGVDVRVLPMLAGGFGAQREMRARDAQQIWYVTNRGSSVPRLLEQPGARLIAYASPLGARRDQELTRLQQELTVEFRRAGVPGLARWLDSSNLNPFRTVPGVDPTALARVAALNAEVDRTTACRCAVVLVPGRSAASSP